MPAGAGVVAAAPSIAAEPALPATDAKFCSIDNPDCEACQ
jgi:ribonucleoside-diphosphate reductase alpha chain